MGIFQALFGGVPEVRSEPPPEQPPPGSGVLPPPRPTREALTTEAALSLSTVYRSVLILATSVSQLSLGTWKGDTPSDPPTWVRQPDINQSRSAFLETTVTSLALHGNAYWRVVRNARGETSSLTVLDPTRVHVHVDGNGNVEAFSVNGTKVPKRDIRHLSLLRVPGRVEGLGPIQAARMDLTGALDLRQYASEWFENGTVPNGVLTSDQQLTAATAAEYKTQFVNSVSGREPAVLGAGLEYRPIMLPPRDAQFLESRQFSTIEIARLFGIPATYLLAAIEGASMTYTNQEQVDIAFVRYTLMAYLREIEEAMSSLLPRGTEARFKVEVLLRTDTKNRYESYRTAIETGFMSVEEVRKIEGLE